MSFLNWFINPVKNHYFDFSGRASRQTYWMFILVYVIISVVLTIIDRSMGMNVLNMLFSLAVLLPSLGIAARRLHDTGMSGWWLLLSLIPFLGTIVLIIMLVRKGQDMANEYGPVPGMMNTAAAMAMPTPPAADAPEQH